MKKLAAGQALKAIKDIGYIRQGELLEVIQDQGKRILVKGKNGNTDIYRYNVAQGDIIIL